MSKQCGNDGSVGSDIEGEHVSKQCGNDGSVGSDIEGEHEDADERRNRNRERNKEHARRTRIRKKEQLGRLKTRVTELEDESKALQQLIQEKSVASILLGLSAGTTGCAARKEGDLQSSSAASPSSFGECLASGQRKRFLSLDGEDPTPPPMELNVKGHITLVGGCNDGRAQVNWKTGAYFDEDGTRQQLTKPELEALRRERNRMHAKMTRDRKKCFIASLKRVISKLEGENGQLRATLARSRTDRLSTSEEKDAPELCSNHLSGNDYQKKSSSSLFGANIYTVG